MLNCFSIDVEDWFHILNSPSAPPIEKWGSLESHLVSNLECLLEMLDETGVKATLFWLGWVAERHKALVRECMAQGHEIASHGYAHVMPSKVGMVRFKEDITRAKKTLEDITGEEVRGFRTAGFGIPASAKWAFDLITETGYKYDSSMIPAFWGRGNRLTYQIIVHTINTQNGQLIEVPVSAFRLFGVRLGLLGGGYLRFLPRWFIRFGTWNLRVSGYPLVLYVHPREIDPSHPRLLLDPLKHFRCYVNIKSTMPKLQWLCENNTFVPMCKLVDAYLNT